jgi:hypothetical protein
MSARLRNRGERAIVGRREVSVWWVLLAACEGRVLGPGAFAVDFSTTIAETEHTRVHVGGIDEQAFVAVDATGDGAPDLVTAGAVPVTDGTYATVVMLFPGPFSAQRGAITQSEATVLLDTPDLASVNDAGDLDGDGSSDLVVTARSRGAYILHGPFRAGARPPSVIALDRLDSGWWSGAGVGDVDEDGLDDLAICGPGSGGAMVLSFVPGPAQVSTRSLPATWSVGPKADTYEGCDHVGSQVGDVTGDGRADIVVATWSSERKDQVQVLSEVPTGGATFEESGLRLGTDPPSTDGGPYQILSAGDANGDGYADLAVNRWGAAGVYFGPLAGHGIGDLNDVGAWVAFGQDSRFALRGDVDGDGADDYAVSSLRESEAFACDEDRVGALVRRSMCEPGAVGTLAGPLTGGVYEPSTRYWGDTERAELGKSLVGDADLDGDGARDLIVSNKTEVILMFGI